MIKLEDQSARLGEALQTAWNIATVHRHEFITPEHLLYALANQDEFEAALGKRSTDALLTNLTDYLKNYMERVPEDIDFEDGSEPSNLLNAIASNAWVIKESAARKEVSCSHVINSILRIQKPCFARDALIEAAGSDNIGQITNWFTAAYDRTPSQGTDSDCYTGLTAVADEEEAIYEVSGDRRARVNFAKCLTLDSGSDAPRKEKSIIGRQQEIRQIFNVLLRRDKKNPIIVGEAGVGKSAIVDEVARLIRQKKAPNRLNRLDFYSVDFGAVMAGAEFRGDIEKRIRSIIDEVMRIGPAIIYFDDLHLLCGQGRAEGTPSDPSSLLKPYLDNPDIYFMGATSYDNYNRTFQNSKAISRHFQKVDVAEPSIADSVAILQGIKPKYERFHDLTYSDEAIEYAVKASAKYLNERFLPDKAIDLIDETGATVALERSESEAPSEGEQQAVGREDVSRTLARICGVESLAETHDDDNNARLRTLEADIRSEIFGQDAAIGQLVEAVLTANAGLIDDNKPMASLLFVGPTGVGKTEVARVLARRLNVPLIRFDMSEYAERHTVAKLIGSPAGYVGYDDGGLLTKAIRKSPHAVLLLDEIEKAHGDIYNILLQVMDYASLTDNKGSKADFRNVIIIMTTNAGARHAHAGTAGFIPTSSAGQNMLKAVKQTFNPEFVNRLSAITVFNDMSREMASLILDKKVGQLAEKLAAKGVKLRLSDAARQWMLDHGFSAEYGGREIDRVINSSLRPMLVRAILFDKLSQGGTAVVTVTPEGTLAIETEHV